jgi:hypothetical protein
MLVPATLVGSDPPLDRLIDCLRFSGGVLRAERAQPP